MLLSLSELDDVHNIINWKAVEQNSMIVSLGSINIIDATEKTKTKTKTCGKVYADSYANKKNDEKLGKQNHKV